MGITHRLLLAVAALVGIGLMILMYGRPTPAPPPPLVASASASPTPAETWRPPVRVDWKKHPPGTQARIDHLGAAGDCDGLQDAFDAAITKDPALAAYADAWFVHSTLCYDAYYQRTQ